MARMYQEQGLGQPLATLLIQERKRLGEVRFVLGAWGLGIVQQLDFWGQVGKPIRCSLPERRQGTADTGIAPIDPMGRRVVGYHQLEGPGGLRTRAAPHITDLRREARAQLPLGEG